MMRTVINTLNFDLVTNSTNNRSIFTIITNTLLIAQQIQDYNITRCIDTIINMIYSKQRKNLLLLPNSEICAFNFVHDSVLSSNFC